LVNCYDFPEKGVNVLGLVFNKTRQIKLFATLLWKPLLCFFILFILLLYPSPSSFAMDDEIMEADDELFRLTVRTSNNNNDLQEKCENCNGTAIRRRNVVEDNDIRDEEEDFEQSASLNSDVSFLIDNPLHPSRLKLNRIIEGMSAYNPKRARLVSPDALPFETAIIIIDLAKVPDRVQRVSRTLEEAIDSRPEVVIHASAPEKWTDTILFLDVLDNKFFIQPISKKTRFLQGLGVLWGAMEPFGPIPLCLYLAQDLFEWLPVGGPVSTGLVISMIGLATPACVRQMWERAEIIGNMWDQNGFTTSKSDKQPHKQPLGIEIETGMRSCCRYVAIPTPLLTRIAAGCSAALRAAPFVFVFWQIESYFPWYRALFTLPLATFYLENTYRLTVDFLTRFEHKRKTEANYALSLKKKGLSERIKSMKKFVNAEGSEKLVEEFYTMIQREMSQKISGKRGSSTEAISALSVLFFKFTKDNRIRRLQQELAEQIHRLKRRDRSQTIVDSDETSPLNDLVEQVNSLPLQATTNLTRDFDNLTAPTTARTLLTGAAAVFTGLATIGRAITTSWVVDQILQVAGFNVAISSGISQGVAIADVIFRAISEWDVQENAFLRLRSLGSRQSDYWGFRLGGTVISVITAGYLTLPTAGITFDALGSDVPHALTTLIIVATIPSEFAGFFEFFRQKYENLITGMVTLKVKTTSQKRAWLNEQLRRLKAFVSEADQETIGQLYNLTQDSL
jgi:hypothetical protein